MSSYTKVEFKSLCRLCITFSHLSDNIFGDDGQSIDVANKLLACLSIKVEKDDPLPKKICNTCQEKLDGYNDFRLSCNNAVSTLECYYSLFQSAIDDEGTIFIQAGDVILPPESKSSFDFNESRQIEDGCITSIFNNEDKSPSKGVATTLGQTEESTVLMQKSNLGADQLVQMDPSLKDLLPVNQQTSLIYIHTDDVTVPPDSKSLFHINESPQIEDGSIRSILNDKDNSSSEVVDTTQAQAGRTKESSVLIQKTGSGSDQMVQIDPALKALLPVDQPTSLVFDKSSGILLPDDQIGEFSNALSLSSANNEIIVLDINKCNILDLISPGASIYVVNTDTGVEENKLPCDIQLNEESVNTELDKVLNSTDVTSDVTAAMFDQQGIDNISEFLSEICSTEKTNLALDIDVTKSNEVCLDEAECEILSSNDNLNNDCFNEDNMTNGVTDLSNVQIPIENDSLLLFNESINSQIPQDTFIKPDTDRNKSSLSSKVNSVESSSKTDICGNKALPVINSNDMSKSDPVIPGINSGDISDSSDPTLPMISSNILNNSDPTLPVINCSDVSNSSDPALLRISCNDISESSDATLPEISNNAISSSSDPTLPEISCNNILNSSHPTLPENSSSNISNSCTSTLRENSNNNISNSSTPTLPGNNSINISNSSASTLPEISSNNISNSSAPVLPENSCSNISNSSSPTLRRNNIINMSKSSTSTLPENSCSHISNSSAPSLLGDSSNDNISVSSDPALPLSMKQLNNILNSNIPLPSVKTPIRFDCIQCEISFKSATGLNRHRVTHILPQKVYLNTKGNTCLICKNDYKDKEALRIHVMQKHQGKKSYACKFCNKSYGRNWHLNRHIESCHSSEVPSKSKDYICHICSKDFISKEGLRQHIQRHNKVLTCSGCNGTFNTKISLLQHKASNCVKKFICEWCSIEFETKLLYLEHINSRCEKRVIHQYECSECSVKFDEKLILAQHIKVHQLFNMIKDQNFSKIVKSTKNVCESKMNITDNNNSPNLNSISNNLEKTIVETQKNVLASAFVSNECEIEPENTSSFKSKSIRKKFFDKVIVETPKISMESPTNTSLPHATFDNIELSSNYDPSQVTVKLKTPEKNPPVEINLNQFLKDSMKKPLYRKNIHSMLGDYLTDPDDPINSSNIALQETAFSNIPEISYDYGKHTLGNPLSADISLIDRRRKKSVEQTLFSSSESSGLDATVQTLTPADKAIPKKDSLSDVLLADLSVIHDPEKSKTSHESVADKLIPDFDCNTDNLEVSEPNFEDLDSLLKETAKSLGEGQFFYKNSPKKSNNIFNKINCELTSPISKKVLDSNSRSDNIDILLEDELISQTFEEHLQETLEVSREDVQRLLNTPSVESNNIKKIEEIRIDCCKDHKMKDDNQIAMSEGYGSQEVCAQNTSKYSLICSKLNYREVSNMKESPLTLTDKLFNKSLVNWKNDNSHLSPNKQSKFSQCVDNSNEKKCKRSASKLRKTDNSNIEKIGAPDQSIDVTPDELGFFSSNDEVISVEGHIVIPSSEKYMSCARKRRAMELQPYTKNCKLKMNLTGKNTESYQIKEISLDVDKTKEDSKVKGCSIQTELSDIANVEKVQKNISNSRDKKENLSESISTLPDFEVDDQCNKSVSEKSLPADCEKLKQPMRNIKILLERFDPHKLTGYSNREELIKQTNKLVQCQPYNLRKAKGIQTYICAMED